MIWTIEMERRVKMLTERDSKHLFDVAGSIGPLSRTMRFRDKLKDSILDGTIKPEMYRVLACYLCHLTPKEAAELVTYHYATVCRYYEGFKMLGIEKYDRLDLLPNREEIFHDDECDTGQATAC
jgi:hypothetical protein